MALLDFFLSRKKSTANIAKERLQSLWRNVVVATPNRTTAAAAQRHSGSDLQIRAD